MTGAKKRNWILSVTPTVWRAIEKKGAYATKSVPETSSVRKNDTIIFYVRGTSKFNCAYKAKSKWHEPSARWPVKVTDEIDVSIIQSGTASIRSAAPLLKFAKRSRWIGLHLHGGLANYGRPISNRDRDAIFRHMGKNPRLFL